MGRVTYRGYEIEPDKVTWNVLLEGEIVSCDLPSEEAALIWIDREKRKQYVLNRYK